jgi:hypothetical protein
MYTSEVMTHGYGACVTGLATKKSSTHTKTCPAPLYPHKSHMNFAGSEFRPLGWDYTERLMQRGKIEIKGKVVPVLN